MVVDRPPRRCLAGDTGGADRSLTAGELEDPVGHRDVSAVLRLLAAGCNGRRAAGRAGGEQGGRHRRQADAPVDGEQPGHDRGRRGGERHQRHQQVAGGTAGVECAAHDQLREFAGAAAEPAERQPHQLLADPGVEPADGTDGDVEAEQ